MNYKSHKCGRGSRGKITLLLIEEHTQLLKCCTNERLLGLYHILSNHEDEVINPCCASDIRCLEIFYHLLNDFGEQIQCTFHPKGQNCPAEHVSSLPKAQKLPFTWYNAEMIETTRNVSGQKPVPGTYLGTYKVQALLFKGGTQNCLIQVSAV